MDTCSDFCPHCFVYRGTISVPHTLKVNLSTGKSQLPWQAGQPPFMICHWLSSCVADLIKLSLCGLGGRLLTTALTWQATSGSVSQIWPQYDHNYFLEAYFALVLNLIQFINSLWNLVNNHSYKVLMVWNWFFLFFLNPLGIWDLFMPKLKPALGSGQAYHPATRAPCKKVTWADNFYFHKGRTIHQKERPCSLTSECILLSCFI